MSTQSSEVSDQGFDVYQCSPLSPPADLTSHSIVCLRTAVVWLLSNLSLVVTSFECLSEYAATGERLREFLESMQHVDPQRSSSAPLLQPPSGESGIVAHKGLYEACDIVEETNDGNFCDNDCCASSFQDSIDLCLSLIHI